MIKFIIDTHLPPKLARWLIEQGHHATHPYFLPEGEEMTDREIHGYALSENCVIITKDKDFFDTFLVKGAPPCVLLLQFGNISNRELISQFAGRLDIIVREFERGANLLFFGFDKISRY